MLRADSAYGKKAFIDLLSPVIQIIAQLRKTSSWIVFPLVILVYRNLTGGKMKQPKAIRIMKTKGDTHVFHLQSEPFPCRSIRRAKTQSHQSEWSRTSRNIFSDCASTPVSIQGVGSVPIDPTSNYVRPHFGKLSLELYIISRWHENSAGSDLTAVSASWWRGTHSGGPADLIPSERIAG